MTNYSERKDGGEIECALGLSGISASLETLSSFPEHSNSTEKEVLFLCGKQSDYVGASELKVIDSLVSPMPSLNVFLLACSTDGL